ncbi:MAG: hypothetical protein ACRD0G_18375 [Acidimicrobiales bacterium]
MRHRHHQPGIRLIDTVANQRYATLHQQNAFECGFGAGVAVPNRNASGPDDPNFADFVRQGQTTSFSPGPFEFDVAPNVDAVFSDSGELQGELLNES